MDKNYNLKTEEKDIKGISVSEICYPSRLLASLKQAHRLQSTLDYDMAVMAFF